MDAGMIMVFAGKALSSSYSGKIDSAYVQRYIKNDNSVGIAIPVEEIEQALGLLVVAGFLDVEQGDQVKTTYRLNKKGWK